MNTTQGILVASLLFVGACETQDMPRTEAEKQSSTSSRVDKEKADKEKADKEKADKEKADKEKADKEKASKGSERAKTDLGADWRGPKHEVWHATWATFAAGKDKTVIVEDWTIERGDAGQYTVSRTKAVSEPARDKVADATLLVAVKAKLILDQEIRARNIDVGVRGGVVYLKGTVASADQAGEAMRIALGTEDVHKVVSDLSWSPRTM